MRIGLLNLLASWVIVGAIGFVAGLFVEAKNKWVSRFTNYTRR